jgi:riboflavin synthase
MFTGIVDHCGHVVAIEQGAKNFRVTIKTEFSDFALGESIAIDGACLTVISIADNNVTVELSPETMRLTTARNYKEGVKVNLERSLKVNDRFGGHFVTGHVDGTCRVGLISDHGEFIEIEFDDFSPSFESYLVKKGCIAVNGVSLTLNDVDENCFRVMLIPHTLQITNLATLKTGDSVNLEFDYLAKLVINQMNRVRA